MARVGQTCAQFPQIMQRFLSIDHVNMSLRELGFRTVKISIQSIGQLAEHKMQKMQRCSKYLEIDKK